MNGTLITTSAGILAVLAAVTSFFFYLEKKTGWKLFNYFPPLLFIYLIPIALSNTGVIPKSSGVYDFMGDIILPVFLVLMLVNVDIAATVRVMGRGVYVMLAGTLGVVIGAPIGFALVKHGLGPETWKAFGALAGSWIGGTGNMAAVAEGLELDESTVDFGYALLADNAVYLIWLPIMLGSKNLANWFHKFTGVSSKRLERMEAAAKELTRDKGKMEMRHVLYLAFLAFAVTGVAGWLAQRIPEIPSPEPYRVVAPAYDAEGQRLTSGKLIVSFSVVADSVDGAMVASTIASKTVTDTVVIHHIQNLVELAQPQRQAGRELYLLVSYTGLPAPLVGRLDKPDNDLPVSVGFTKPVVSSKTYKILLITIFGILLSFTAANRIPGSHALAMALVYLFVARMGARADLSDLSGAVFWFLLGAYVWIFIHGFVLLGAAKLFKVDVHTAAIASAANIGGAASAPIVAAYHKPSLVPVSILMALLGYAIGNFAAFGAGYLCRWVSG